MKIRILGNVRHDNVTLKKYEVYDIPEKDAQPLIDAGDATIEGVDDQTQTRTHTPMKNKVDPDTKMRIPGEFEPDTTAKEGDTGGIKGVEPENTTEVKGTETPPDQPQNQQNQQESDSTQKKGD